MSVFIDGASQGNPGPAGAGVSFRDASQSEVEALSVFLGEATNNVAEYRALILALERARELGVRRLTVFSDSELLVKQFHGQYRVKNAGLRPHFEKAKELQGDFEELIIRHIPRDKNERADQLARQAASRQRPSRQGSAPSVGGRLTRGVLSLNDVSLLPIWSDVLPDQVTTELFLVGDIRLGIPLLGSLVASPEAASFAAVMALRGALAVLRPSRSSQEQVAAVQKVKASTMSEKQAGEAGSAVLSCRDEGGRLRVGGLVHPGQDLLEKVRRLVEAGVDLLILEASLGHGPELVEGVADIKEKFPRMPLIAGDVTDSPGTRAALKAGADGVKVGAPYILGLKVPLFTAIQECTRVVEEQSKVLIADVGTTELMMASSRVTRAMGAGACAAMATLEPSGEEWQPQILAEGLDNLVDDVRMIMSCCGVRTVQELRFNARFVSVRGGSEI